MNEKGKTIALDLSDYEKSGLYILKDLGAIVLTKENIEKTTAEYWNNPEKFSPEVKKTIDFQRCDFCPLKGAGDFCDALRPVLPFLDIMDKFVSYDEVIALYKEDAKELFNISHTTMQEALKYISILSLIQYCQIGKKYRKYYSGIIPLMEGKDVAKRMYLNIYWICKGDKEEINKIISNFIDDIRTTSANQVKRLNSICKTDSCLNAFVGTQVITEFLAMDIEKTVERSFDNSL